MTKCVGQSYDKAASISSFGKWGGWRNKAQLPACRLFSFCKPCHFMLEDDFWTTSKECARCRTGNFLSFHLECQTTRLKKKHLVSDNGRAETLIDLCTKICREA
ncbi:hypothetical protein QYM36_008163 [Artemia franciscana]|uniref:Uncharacterized protein n=1 Tax=Artemia franciscana TaxID=6661 RepID=A0AA88LEH2_ARTSF|nr:hypothetical protein QYM36_008163 [Artemia franciscana]